jgi:hypothetical protein
MSLNIGYGVIREDGDAYYRPTDPAGDWIVYEDWTLLLQRLREQHGTVNITISEGLMNERFRYTAWEMPCIGRGEHLMALQYTERGWKVIKALAYLRAAAICTGIVALWGIAGWIEGGMQ